LPPPARQGLAIEGFRRAMNAPTELDPQEVLRVKLEVLRCQHRDLDDAIRALEDRGTADQLSLRRLKKQKLLLKDHIARIRDILTPDIIA
jgi:hypothetical protein